MQVCAVGLMRRRRWWGSRIAAGRWAIESRDPQQNPEEYQDYYRNLGLVYAAEKAFFSSGKAS